MNPSAETILVVDDDPYIQEALQDRLEALGYRVSLAADGQEALEIVERKDPQLILLDIEMPGMKGLDVLKEIRRKERDVPVIMITAYGSIDLAVQAMKEGAYDFVPKPFDPGHVALVVGKAMERQRLRGAVQVLSEQIDKRYRLVSGMSSKMKEAIEAARKAAASQSTVLLLGESGTGKELFARAIHNWSGRKDRSFVAINCVGLSTTLLESELFGYERGAFTGAQQRKRGKIELAHGGTVFLDEIGDISQELQAKLLRFLQEREFERVGGTELIHVDVRIIGATNRQLAAAVKEGHFREDLYYRINVVPIMLPSLRERKDDIPALVQHFIHWFSKESKKNFTGISEEALDRLASYDWPGNVRELANIIERAIVLGRPTTIQVEDLPAAVFAPEADAPPADSSYHESVDAYRRELILRTLAQTQGNRSAAAKVLGLERSYFVKLMKGFDIS
jgi:DNA-binding NtrC family response regulator